MKGIAIPYIIALILGIAVVALIGYWFFVLGGRMPGQVTVSNCQTKQNLWCSELARTGVEPNEGDWDTFAFGCSGVGINAPTQEQCNDMLGLTGGEGDGGQETL